MQTWIFVLSLVVIAGCETLPGKISYEPPKSVELNTPLGAIKFNFSEEQKRPVASSAQLAASKGALLFSQFGFSTGPLPEGCKPFESGRYGRFIFPYDGAAVGKIRDKVEALKKETGAPDEAAIALSVYEADAFHSVCGPIMMAKLKPESSINGWTLNEAAVKKFGSTGQGEVDVTSHITIVAINKEQIRGRLKPTAANVLLSRFRFEIPPNSESLASDPKTGSTVLAYSMELRDVTLGNVTRNVLYGGALRIFVGKTYIYLIDFSTNTAGIEASKWDAYQNYIEGFHYVGDAPSN